MKEKVLEILLDVVPDVDFENETDLVAGKVIDSFAVVAMVNQLNDDLDIDIPSREILPENFYSLDTIVALVEKYS
ncbi:MAG: phosphopantetheine-binding protein [Oscillospiraceae bacterium]|nr:phosphopantetheine-binding protein [Oscillospiraceae bacterium]MCD8323201.1 phosphopantetheine-binding protein [Oscillospiraceae bacterium]